MILILSLVILILAVLLAMQLMKLRARSRQLDEIHQAVNAIKEAGTLERVLLFTDDVQLQRLLVDMNRLIEDTHQVGAKQRALESSMRRMLSNISHDLKTPLTVVLGYTETMIQDNRLSDEEREKLLHKVHSKAAEVLELINKFFDLAKLESGDKQLPLTPVNAGEVCRRNILSFYDLIHAQGMEVNIEIPESPIFLLSNEEALDRILHNLISNAIRYGSEGKLLGLSLRADESDVVIEVWDRGKGIQESHQDKVFERMYTLEDSRNKSYQGSGLGLTITKRLVEQLNGRITLSSKPDVRTTFTVKFPRMKV
ncbi:sensor histidine kinase [Paenibacillus sp. YPG26]|uniref:sensor histidine kinase n=1 Tax=Paenibacillus sp. YPG26 TaxID=2878915 RepID=UPI00203E230C|nr:sensor histidine kinase [Paenibacillus sp. YPG26]USB33788.1 sensor histidine kinase [Paenibacillus sp. YPG26]